MCFLLNQSRRSKYVKGVIFKFLKSCNEIKIGNNLLLTGYPNLVRLKHGELSIGNNVQIGRNVDLRVYENCKLIIDDDCKIDDGVRIIAANGSVVHLFEKTKIGYFSVLNGGGGIEIGPNSSTYGFVYIQSSEHELNRDNTFSKSKFNHNKIKVGASVLVGSHSVLLPGANIRSKQIVAPHSIIKGGDNE